MKKLASTKQIKEAENTLINNGIDEFQLTNRAVSGMQKYFDITNKCLIVCGSGNNAGDGYLLALSLLKRNIFVEILAVKEAKNQTAKYFSQCCKEQNIIIYEDYKNIDLSRYNCIIDAVFGTGFNGEISGEIKEVFDFINESKIKVFAIDIPSGLTADLGLKGGVVADKVLTIGAEKTGLYLNKGKDYAKSIEFVDIGLNIDTDMFLFENDDCKDCLSERKNFSNKGNYGYVGLIGGCENYVGAIKLATMSESAVCVGAGVSRLIVPSSIKPAVMELTTLSTIFYIDDDDGHLSFNKKQLDLALNKVKTLAFGMGIGLSDGARETLKYILENYSINLIIDADGLKLLSEIGLEILNRTACHVVLTPHLGEFSVMTGKNIDFIVNNLIDMVKDFTAKYNAVLLLKGPSTIVADKSKLVITNKGCSGMATAGSGDVLSGILCGILGYNKVNVNSVLTGCYINGLAGELASNDLCNISMTSLDTLAKIKSAVAMIVKDRC